MDSTQSTQTSSATVLVLSLNLLSAEATNMRRSTPVKTIFALIGFALESRDFLP